VSQQMWQMTGNLVGEVIARRRGRAMAEQQRIAARPPLKLFQPIVASLRVDAWHDGPGAQFGCPWGWVATDSGLVAGAAPDRPFVLQPERDDFVAQIQGGFLEHAASTNDILDLAATLEEEREASLRLTPYAPMTYAIIDGALALIVQFHGKLTPQDASTSVVVEVWTTAFGRLYEIVLYTPEENYSAYMQVLWTVLGSWRWR
jgi:hypothetical protein